MYIPKKYNTSICQDIFFFLFEDSEQKQELLQYKIKANTFLHNSIIFLTNVDRRGLKQ